MNITSERNFKEYSFFFFPPRQSTYVKAFKWQKFHACFPRISWLSPDNFLRVAARRGSLLYLNCFFYNIYDKKHHMILFSLLHNENSEPLCGGKFTFSWVVALQQLSSTDSKITTILYSMIERNIWKYFSLSSYRLRQVPQDLRNFL